MVSNLASGFTNSPTEIAIVIGLMVIGLVALIGTAWLLRRRKRRRLEAEGARTFAELADRHGLSDREQEVLVHLASYLEQPHRRYLLLRNQSLFDRVATLGERDEVVTASQVSALRVRLGFGGSRAGTEPAGTTELPERSALLLRPANASGSQSASVTIVKQQPEALVTSRPDLDLPFEQGSEVIVYYFDDSGVYRASTHVIKASYEALYLAHAEGLDRLQRREFNREAIRIPAVIRDSGKQGAAGERCTLLDVGGGGARVYTPDRTLPAETHVDLTLHPQAADAMRVPGVVRRSRGNVSHIEFDRLSRSARDRLYRLMFERERSLAKEKHRA